MKHGTDLAAILFLSSAYSSLSAAAQSASTEILGHHAEHFISGSDLSTLALLIAGVAGLIVARKRIG